MKKIMMSAVALTAIMGSVNTVSAENIDILSDIKVKGEIRVRYENADVIDNGVDAGNAFTARTELAITGGLLGVENLTATVGLSSVNNFGYTNYAPEDANYDTIGDPQQAMLSQASIDYKLNKTAFHFGRSHVNLDNQRFIGTVGWRQMERSYDTVLVSDSSVKNLNLIAAYVYGYAGVNSVTTTDTNSVLLHANYKVMDELTITGYGYLLADIHDTYGIALTGKVKAGPAKLDYRAEYAMQQDATMELYKQDVKADANYMNLDVGANISGILVGANYEYMSGASVTGGSETTFTTPLATAHKFNGWADAVNKNQGLIDMNARIGYTAKGLGKILAVYHDFTADEVAAGADDDRGSEIDVLYTNKIPGVNNLNGLIKYALFSAPTGSDDVQKAWVQLDYKF